MHTFRGFTLLEVMISLFLLSLVLLGVTAVEVKMLREARGIGYFNRSVLFAENMAAYMQVHGGESSTYFQEWQREIQENLPSAAGRIAGKSPHYTITINWGGNDIPCQQTRSGLSGCVILNITA